MSDTSVTSKGQVTIPKAVRQQLGIRAGSKVRIVVEGRHARLELVSTAVPVAASGAGMLAHRPGDVAVPVDFDVASLCAPDQR